VDVGARFVVSDVGHGNCPIAGIGEIAIETRSEVP
jgi:hypothetical protein